MLKLMMITANSEIAQEAIDAGVDRIFIDLELIGKKERQGHLDTVISGHNLEDILALRPHVPKGRLLVRTNPLHPGIQEEVNSAIGCGADLLMLPMAQSSADVAEYVQLVGNRGKVIPLVETAEGMRALDEICRVPGVGEIYFGLNDLYLSLGMKFIFEPLAEGWVDDAARIAREAGIPFGFGGVGRVGEGALAAEQVLKEHSRLGSSSVILSRSFHGRAKSLEEMRSSMNLSTEIGKIRQCEMAAGSRGREQVEIDRKFIQETIRNHVRNIRLL